MIDWSLVLSYALPSGIGSALTGIIFWKIYRSKEQGLAQQETGRGEQESVKAKKDLADLERDIYTRIVNTMQSQFDVQSLEIKELKSTQNELLITNQLQGETIKHLQKTVDDYKLTCDTCQIRIEKKKK